MLNTINFPNLGFEFESVGYGVSIFGVHISYYGILMVLALLAGIGVILLQARYTGQHMEDYLELAIVTIPAAVVGARIYYVLFSWNIYKKSFWQIFALWEGGFAFYGALIGGLIAIVIFTRFRQMWTAEVLDTAALGLLIGQVIGSWGSYFNREAFGEYTDGLFAMQLPIDALRIADITDKMRNHMVELNGVRFVQVQPVFLYQSFLCLILFVGLFIYQRNKAFDGEVFWIAIGGYSLGRIWLEGLRTDALKLPVFNWPVSRVVAIFLLILSVVSIIYNRKMDGKGRMRKMRQKNEVIGANHFENLFEK